MRISHRLRLGFVSADFARVQGKTGVAVGDNHQSWAVDGSQQKKFHRDERLSHLKPEAYYAEYENSWKVGDVVGLACDLQSLVLLVSVNGSWGWRL